MLLGLVSNTRCRGGLFFDLIYRLPKPLSTRTRTCADGSRTRSSWIRSICGTNCGMLLLPKVLISTCWLAHFVGSTIQPCSRRPTSCRVASARSYQGCSSVGCSARPADHICRQRCRRRGLGNLRRRPSYQGRRRPRRRRCKGSVRSRDPKSKKPAARPLAKSEPTPMSIGYAGRPNTSTPTTTLVWWRRRRSTGSC